MVKIGVLGAGSWGLGLAMLLHNNGHDVTVWSVFPDEINELNATRENKNVFQCNIPRKRKILC